jgi:CubicO group peptidase (beta-lactamase class C family)
MKNNTFFMHRVQYPFFGQKLFCAILLNIHKDSMGVEMFAKTKPTLIFAAMLLSFILSACGAPVEALPTAISIPATPTSQSESIEQAVDEYITSDIRQLGFSGSILIAQGDNILVSKSYGMANIEFDIPNSAQTIFRLGSITKQFTAMAMMILQEEGRLNVQDLICDYVPNCPETWQSVSIHHLLTHSSGIPNYTNFSDFEFQKKYTVNEIIDTFIDMPLRFPPGSGFRYSNSGYVVLGFIIEQVSGNSSYEEFLDENIFQPLHMMNTGYEHNNQNLEGRASGYMQMADKTLGNADYVDMSTPFSAGALYSTVEDLYLWDRALYTETLVSENSLEMMFSNYESDYGYGWNSFKIAGRNVKAHGGDIFGFSANIARFVDDDVVIIVLSNIENVDTLTITRALAAIIFQE